MTTVLAVWAHPDDEAFGPSGLFRALHERGMRLVIVTATYGEGGGLGEPPLTTREHLAEFRAQELRRSCEIMGVDRLELWDYADGGLKDVAAVELRERVLAVLNEEQPAVVLTFGPDGIYGHPDHTTISAATTQAFAQYVACHAQETPPRLYFVTISPELSKASLENAAGDASAPRPLPPTAIINLPDYADVKLQTLKAHASQHQDWERLLALPGDWLSAVYLHRAYPPVAPSDALETELFA